MYPLTKQDCIITLIKFEKKKQQMMTCINLKNIVIISKMFIQNKTEFQMKIENYLRSNDIF